MNKVIVIAGPTATGKTAAAVSLAKEINGEVVSADSVQIYKKLNIGSAKPSIKEMGNIPHHMIDILEPDETFSVSDFCDCAKKVIADIHMRGNVPIVAGGTGLYISSLVDNISFVREESDKSVRETFMQELSEIGNEAMHEKLKKIDPEAAVAIHPNNARRVIRALEVFYTTGKTLTEQNAMSKLEKSPFDFILCGLSCDRELLYDRINKRVDNMVSDGLFEEVSSLLSDGISPDCQSMQGIGYKEVVAYLSGKINCDECIEKIKQNSRNYAKRQLTWFRRGKYKWFDCLKSDLHKELGNYVGEFMV